MAPRKRPKKRTAAKKKPVKRTTAKRATKRKTVAKPTKAAAARKRASKKPQLEEKDLPERGVYMDVPWEHRKLMQHYGVKFFGGNVRGWVYPDKATLPDLLQPYLPSKYSWLAWRQWRLDGMGDSLTSEVGNPDIKLRKYQQTACNNMVSAYKLGAPSFMLTHGTGLGKTYTSIEFAKKAAKKPLNVLIIAPIAVHEQWARALNDIGTGNKRFCIINYESLKQLVTVPPSAIAAKGIKTKNRNIAKDGVSIEKWDIIIDDESHKLRNPDAMQTRIWFTLRHGHFTVQSSATPGQVPSELVYASDIFEYRATGTCGWDHKNYHKWATSLGVDITKSDYGSLAVKWGEDPDDLATVNDILYKQTPILGDSLDSSSIPGWPELQRIPHPVKLTQAERKSYDMLWTEFQKSYHLAKKGKNPVNGLAAQIRFRQKTSILRAPYVAELIKMLLNNGYQVPVSMEFREGTQILSELLDKNRIKHTIINGDLNAKEKEENRLKFQRGEVPVILYSVKEGISLHANEEAVDGSSTQRYGIIADPMWSGISTKQVEGRQHRAGENAPIYHVFINGTIDEKVVIATIKRLDSLNVISGNDEKSIQEEFEEFFTAA